MKLSFGVPVRRVRRVRQGERRVRRVARRGRKEVGVARREVKYMRVET